MTNIPQKCSVIGCNGSGHYDTRNKKVYFIKGLCNKHYRRLVRHGKYMSSTRSDPRPAIIEGDIAKIPLGIDAKDGYAIVDADMAWVADKYKWVLEKTTNYAVCSHTRLHNVVMGKIPQGMVIDHINRIGTDNRRANLRIATPAQNIQNSIGHRTKSKYKGVTKSTKNRYRARYYVAGNEVVIGYFSSEVEAAKAYDKAAKERWGEFAYQNFPTS